MSTQNIGFYELSSNIIKYTPYFFCSDGLALRLNTLFANVNKWRILFYPLHCVFNISIRMENHANPSIATMII